MKHFTAINYIAIDIANTFGLDKLNYEDRIQWVRDNLNQTKDITGVASVLRKLLKQHVELRVGLALLPVKTILLT